MYFHNILASATTSYVFDAILIFIIILQQCNVYPKWDIPSLCAAILDKRAPCLPNDKRGIKRIGLNKFRFQQNLLKLGFVVWLSLYTNYVLYIASQNLLHLFLYRLCVF